MISLTKKQITLFSLLCLGVCFSKSSIANDRSYGSRINLDPNTPVTADFIDRDGDGIDDRYQLGPYQAPKIRYPTVLPKVSAINIPDVLGIPTLREGIRLYEEYVNYIQFKHSKLRPLRPRTDKELDSKINAQLVKAIVFDFPDSVRIIKLVDNKKIAIDTKRNSSYEYYELIE